MLKSLNSLCIFNPYKFNFCALTLHCPNSSFHRILGYNLGYSLVVYRLIVATLIGNFFGIRFKIEIKTSAQCATFGTLGSLGLKCNHCSKNLHVK